MSRCRSCQAQILWARTPKGMTIPIDASPTPKGNLYLYRDYNGQGDNRVEYITKGDAERSDSFRFTSHFATCPNAEAWRQRR